MSSNRDFSVASAVRRYVVGPRSTSLPALLVFAFLAAASTVAAGVVHVATTGVDANGCGTLATPCASFRFALSNIAQTSDTIELAAGVYVDSGPTIEFSSASGNGNITIKAAAGLHPQQVTVDRVYNGRLFKFTTGAGTVQVSGIRFYRGGWQVADSSQDYTGAFMQFLAEDPDVEFTDCIFEANINPNKGYGGRGGVGTIRAGAPRFANCVFSANWGGIAGAFHISGTSSPVFDGCTFEHSGCHAGGWGGVVVPEDQSTGVWKNSVFRNNACDYGGAVDDGGTAAPLFVNCQFENNFGSALGGAYYGFGNTHTKFKGCRFFGNRVGKGGLGQDYYLSSSASTTFEDSTFDSGPNPVLISDGASGAAKDNSTLTMRGCSVQGYRSALGVIIVSIDGRGTFESTLFTGNECVKGGAIMATSGPVFVRNSTFVNNIATEGGAIALVTASTTVNRIVDSHFEGNVGKNIGGAIRLGGSAVLEIVGSTFVSNTVQGVGGGAIYLSSDATLTVNGSHFEDNQAPSGGAIWSEGKLVAVDSEFRGNYLLSNEEDSSDSCGSAAGTGGAIYSSLPSLLALDDGATENTSSACKMSFLRLESLVLDGNNASLGGGGAIFLDQSVPLCMTSKELACVGCTFTGNDAAYGSDVATIVNALDFPSPNLPGQWMLMTGNDIVIGARDLLGQALQGSHTPVLVRVKLLTRDEDGDANASASSPTTVFLTANASRTIRNGEANFKSVMLQMALGQTNSVDLPLTLSFTSDSTRSSSSSSSTMNLLVPIVLEKCPQNGALNADGTCLIEATGGSEKLIAGIIFSVVVGGFFMFILYWSYKNSNRVMETIRQLVTGVGSIIIKFVFELLDIVSDVQTLVNLFVYDVTLSHPTFVRIAYVTCFVLSLAPTAFLIHATIQNVFAQWKRTKSKKALTFRNKIQHALSVISSRENATMPVDESKASTDGTAEPLPAAHRFSVVNAWKQHRPRVSDAKVVVHEQTKQLEEAHTQRRVAGNLMEEYINREIDNCEQELEYYRTRGTLMKRVLARLVTEDLLLLVLNMYIYLSNHSDDMFLRSKFRSSLEFSIFMSAVHFGSQGQAIVTWLQVNKVGEIKKNILSLKTLQESMESVAKASVAPPIVQKSSVDVGVSALSSLKKIAVQPVLNSPPGAIEYDEASVQW